MSTPNTFKHFIGYFWRSTGNKFLLAFTGIFLLFVPAMALVDHYGTKRRYGYVPSIHEGSWFQSSLIFGAIVLGVWIAIIIYTIVKYKRYLNKKF